MDLINEIVISKGEEIFAFLESVKKDKYSHSEVMSSDRTLFLFV